MKQLAYILLACLIATGANAKSKTLEIGQVPPDYIGKTMDGTKLNVSDFAGKVVVVTFWATWCAPCRAELPVLEAIQRQVPNEVKVVAVNYKEDRRIFRKAVKSLDGYELTFTRDSGSISRKYKVKGIPNMFIIDRNGTIANIHVGYGEGMIPRLADELNALIRQKAAPVPSTTP